MGWKLIVLSLFVAVLGGLVLLPFGDSPSFLNRALFFAGVGESPTKEKTSIRIGILGAANIVPMSLLNPAHFLSSVEIVAVAARDKNRAEQFAKKHGIKRVLDSYDDLINDPEIDAIYNPLPNSLHYSWTIKAIKAGKHILLEKPFTSNAEEAQNIVKEIKAQNARGGANSPGQRYKGDIVVIEAFHWRMHPLALRVRDVIRSGILGKITNTNASLIIPKILFNDDDIRYNLALAGGALMDVGSYTVSASRWISIPPGDYLSKPEKLVEPTVASATAILQSDRVDHTMQAELNYPNGIVSHIDCSLRGSTFSSWFSIVGERGYLEVWGFVSPSLYHYLTITINEIDISKTTTVKVYGNGGSSYYYQLVAFVKAVKREISESEWVAQGIVSAEEAVRNMKVIDAIYEKSGLGKRG